MAKVANVTSSSLSITTQDGLTEVTDEEIDIIGDSHGDDDGNDTTV